MISSFAFKLDVPDDLALGIPKDLKAFPPSDDFPVIVTPDGLVVSRYGDHIWRYAPLIGNFVTINFGDGPRTRKSIQLGRDNASILRQVVLFYHYGERPPVKPTTMYSHVKLIMPIFRLCEKNKISVSSLGRYPAIMQQLPAVLKVKPLGVIVLLHEIYNARHVLGFFILTPAELKDLAAEIPKREVKQTAYIPPRIWAAQVKRLREMLDEYLEHREAFESMMQYCIDAFVRNYGSLECALDSSRNPWRSPFCSQSSMAKNGAYVGTFFEVATKFGVANVIERWVMPVGKTLGGRGSEGATYFARYLSAVTFVGLIYLANFSGMRRSEVGGLRANCLRVDKDERIGDIYLLQGETSKTIEDDSALWITSPTSRVALEAMKSVTMMRINLAISNPKVPTTKEDTSNPYLNNRAYEPWGQMRVYETEAPTSVLKVLAYRDWKDVCPRLFDSAIFKITPEDLALSRLVTPSLDEAKFAVGNIWPFSLHQLRRTLVVNATHSGMISDGSLQYEMKHQTRGMSLYYGQGYSHLPVNGKIQREYVNAMYEALAGMADRLLGERFISPLGSTHKNNIIQFLSGKSHIELMRMAKKGDVAIRETLLGVCLNRNYCEFGGVEHLVECTNCDKALVDKQKKGLLKLTFNVISDRIELAQVGTPDYKSLIKQEKAIKEVLDVINID